MNKVTLFGYRLERWVNARWKALVPLLVYVVSELAHQTLDLNTPAGVKAAVMAALTAVLVYLKRNVPPST